MSSNQPKETLSFKIGLNGTFWDKLPEYSIYIDDEFISSGAVQSTTHYVEFSKDLLEDSHHKLIIKLTNKTDDDTIQSEDKSKILKDLLLNIVSIEIDGIPLEQLLWDASKFVADDPDKPTLIGCVNLGWNGSYIIEFNTPFYLWLLENL